MGPPYWAHLDESPVDYREARYGIDELANGKPGHTPIHPQCLTRLSSERASDDAVFARSLRG